jgi:hypothetical protein
MAVKSKGRGAAATFGLLLVLVGVAGAVALWVMADRRPDQAVEGFARGPVGCTTTLEFGDTGTFYVFRETVADDSDVLAECDPVPTPGVDFGVELLSDGEALPTQDDSSISYDTSTAIGESVARIEIDMAGRYDLVVEGDDPSVVAAVGRDPELGVAELRRGAIVVGVVGVVLGALMLLLAGRRSKRAATFTVPDGPGWGPQPAGDGAPAAWPPEPPRVPAVSPDAVRLPEPVPAAPQLLPEPAEPVLPPEPLPAEPLPAEPVLPPEPLPPAEPAEPAEPVPAEPVLPAESVSAESVSAEPVSAEPVFAEPTFPTEPPGSGAGPGSPWGAPSPAERKDPPPPA